MLVGSRGSLQNALCPRGLPEAVLDGPERDLRALFDYRQTLVTQRTATVSRLRWDLHAFDPSIDPKPRSLSRSAPLKALLPIIDRFDGVDARLAARRVATCIELTAELYAEWRRSTLPPTPGTVPVAVYAG